MSADTQPTVPFPEEWQQADAAPRRRRRVWPWLVAVAVVLALIVAAFFAGEWVARDLVTKTVRQQIVSRLDLPADHPVDIEIGDPSLLLSLLGGNVGEVRLASDDVTLGGVTGDVEVDLRDLAIRPPFTIGTGTARVALDTPQLQALLATVEGFPAQTVGIAEPNITASTELSLFGAAIPLALALTPSAADGDLVLTPAALQLGGADITADGLRQRFGGLADTVLQGWRVCIADELPAGIPLRAIAVDGDVLVADFDISPDLLTDSAQLAKGSCA